VLFKAVKLSLEKTLDKKKKRLNFTSFFFKKNEND